MLLGTVLDALTGGRINGRGIATQPRITTITAATSRMMAIMPSKIRSSTARHTTGIQIIPVGTGRYCSVIRIMLIAMRFMSTSSRGRSYNSGYEEGFLAGQAARYNGYNESAYNDPYFSEDAGYGYGAYSICLNRQRRLLSDGYERGYQDALNRNNIYDAQNGGDVDLVSLMLSSASGCSTHNIATAIRLR